MTMKQLQGYKRDLVHLFEPEKKHSIAPYVTAAVMVAGVGVLAFHVMTSLSRGTKHQLRRCGHAVMGDLETMADGICSMLR